MIDQTQQNRPSDETEAAEVHADGPNFSQSTRLVGHTVEKALDATIWRLVLGELQLHECTPAIVGLYSLGFWHGQESRESEVTQATADRDRYFELWANPGTQLTDMRLRSMREAAEEYWREFIAGGAE